MKTCLSATMGLILCCSTIASAENPKADADRFARWEKEILALEKRQKDSPPPKDGIAFAGSSTIRLWDLKKSFPNLPVYNCGFGGSEIRDVTHFADRILLSNSPKIIVFYAGDNDVNSKRTPEQVRDDFQAFATAVHARLPKTKIILVSVKPSPSRWKLAEQQKTANKLVADYCKKDDRLVFVDVFKALLGEDGMPKTENYAKDKLHLSPGGYDVLNNAVRPLLKP